MPVPTILVVDDEALIRWSLAERLTAEGYRVVEAATVAEALAKAEEGVDLTLLDYRLPDGEGLSVLRACRARLEYLPPYSPDLNPIENLWSKVKQGLKSRAPRNARQLFKAAGAAFDAVTSEDCHGFFLHAGYAT